MNGAHAAMLQRIIILQCKCGLFSLDKQNFAFHLEWKSQLVRIRTIWIEFGRIRRARMLRNSFIVYSV